MATIRAAFEPRQDLHDVIVDGDRVAVRWTLRGSHVGPFIGLPATGRPVEVDGVDLYAMRDGRMAAHWNVVGLWALCQQIGGAVTARAGAPISTVVEPAGRCDDVRRHELALAATLSAQRRGRVQVRMWE